MPSKPTPTSPESRRARSALARKTSVLGPDDPATVEARREYAAERFADHVRAIDDPVVLSRAAQIVRAALARQRAAEIPDSPDVPGQGPDTTPEATPTLVVDTSGPDRDRGR